MAAAPDPRVALRQAFEQAGKTVDGVAPGQLRRPTPCAEFDVEALLDHMLFGARLCASVASGGAPPESSATVTAPSEGWSAAFDAARRAAAEAWEDASLLTRDLDLGWAVLRGDVAAGVMTMEVVAHTWDLAQATGQLGGLDPALAEQVLAFAPMVLPAEPRGGEIPFAAVVPVPDGAPAYDRLAGFLGRRP